MKKVQLVPVVLAALHPSTPFKFSFLFTHRKPCFALFLSPLFLWFRFFFLSLTQKEKLRGQQANKSRSTGAVQCSVWGFVRCRPLKHWFMVESALPMWTLGQQVTKSFVWVSVCPSFCKTIKSHNVMQDPEHHHSGLKNSIPTHPPHPCDPPWPLCHNSCCPCGTSAVVHVSKNLYWILWPCNCIRLKNPEEMGYDVFSVAGAVKLQIYLCIL